GHLLNLGHTGPYNASPDRPTSLIAATQQFGVYDMMLWSIMSYIAPDETNAKFFSSYPVTGTNWGEVFDPRPADEGGQRNYSALPTTPMMLDIEAAQRIYGRPTSGPLSDGDDIFGFNSNLDVSIKDFFDFTVNKNPVITIWDGGVDNTLDLSGWNADATINLTPGTFTSANAQVNNIAIARDTVVETAIGGGGNDKIYGSSFANVLIGNAGSDWLDGGRANDTDTGGPGSDYFVLAEPQDGFD